MGTKTHTPPPSLEPHMHVIADAFVPDRFVKVSDDRRKEVLPRKLVCLSIG